jgi:hypothetical protein
MACQCTDCQKFSGAPFRVLAFLLCDGPADDLIMPGDAIMPIDDAVNAVCHLTG